MHGTFKSLARAGIVCHASAQGMDQLLSELFGIMREMQSRTANPHQRLQKIIRFGPKIDYCGRGGHLWQATYGLKKLYVTSSPFLVILGIS